MRFLGVGETCDLGSLYLRLAAEGHEVKVAVSEPLARGTLAGMADRIDDWRGALEWVRAAGEDGVILFESVTEGFGARQDELRRQNYQVIGGSAFGDRLENDRAFGQQFLAELDFPSGHVWSFEDAGAADAFIASQPGRYVLKFSGGGDNYVGQMTDGQDVRAMLASQARAGAASGSFILMTFHQGVEMGVGAYFDGERFLLPACLDWEHKRFFTGDLGELTGEMGTVATYSRSRRFFERTLGKAAPALRAHGHVGYVNLNTIVNDAGIWPLEFTCRFGYPGFAILDPLQADGWGTLFRKMVRKSGEPIAVRPGFSVGVVLTTPPFPYSRKEVAAPVGLPLVLDGEWDEDDRRNLHPGEIGMDGGHMVTSGLYGWTVVVTGVENSIAEARAAAYRRAARIVIPNMRYRLDIGDRLIAGDYARVEALGLLSPD